MPTIFSSPSFDAVADEVARSTRADRGFITRSSFSDGWPNLFIEDVRALVADRTVWYLSDISRRENLFDELAVMQALPRYAAAKVNIVTPYLPTGTMERVDSEGQIATAKTLARILSATPAAERGMTAFHAFDIHALQERFYFGDNISFRPHSALDLLRARVSDMAALSIAFPDDGACKRFGRDFPDMPKIVCAKTRDGDRRIVSVRE
jgi:phosphoribosylpyrophosphate synthetase